jgi:O-antigen/teichoic acid export membrane protein
LAKTPPAQDKTHRGGPRYFPVVPPTTPSDSPESVADPSTAPQEAAALPSRHISRSLISSSVYSIGFGVQRAIGVVMLPFYTRAISPSEYGTLGILLSFYVAVGVLFSAALEPWIVRNYFQLAAEPKRRQESIDSIWRFLVVYPLVVSLVLATAVWSFLGSSSSISGLEVSLMLFASALNATATTLPLAILRARQDLRGYLWITAVTAIGTPALTALFVVFLHQGVRGWFLALLIVNFAAFVTATVVVPWRPRGHINWKIVSSAVLFSIPLIPHFISSWALQLADRLVIAGIVSNAQLGIYSLASNLASPLLLLVMALNQGFIPTYAKAGTQIGHEKELSNVVVLQITVVIGLTLAGAMLGASAVDLLTPPEYHSAAPLVPWIVLGYGFLGVYFVPMNGATLGVGRRNFAWVSSASSAATNIALLLIFVPKYGVYSAAVASAIGYFVLLVMMAIWAHARYNPVRYNWVRIGQAVTLGILAYAGAALTTPRSPVGAIIVQTGWLLGFAAAISTLIFRSQLVQKLGFATNP